MGPTRILASMGLPMGRYRMVVQEEGRAPRAILLGDPIVVGRSHTADVVVDDEQCGRRQFRVSVVAGSVVLESLGSTNALQVGDAPLLAGERSTIPVGTRLRIGRTSFLIETADPEPTPAPPPAPDPSGSSSPRPSQSEPEPAEAGGPRAVKVFISHSSDDHQRVDRGIVSRLKRAGIRPWYSAHDLPPAEDFNAQIVEQLRSADWFVVVLSPRAVGSRWVRGEVKLAFDLLPERIVPIVLEGCDIAKCDVRLTNLQALSFEGDGDAAIDALLRRFSRSGSADAEAPEQSGLVDKLRTARDKPEFADVRSVFEGLAWNDRQIVDRARQALRALGWPRVSRAVEQMARSGDDAAIGVVLEGIAVLEVQPEIVGVIERALDVLEGAPRKRAIELLDRKRLGLELDALQQTFDEQEFGYELADVLGQGLFAASYRAKHRLSNLPVVVRVLRPQLFDRYEVRDAFRKLLADSMHYRHQHLVTTRAMGVFRDQRLLWCVRDYVDGVPLQEALHRGRRFSPQQSLEILIQIIGVLESVHERNRAHGGVKPTNVFVRGPHEVVLGDPGLPMCGLPMDLPRLEFEYRFAAPESFTNLAQAAPAADVYSLGCLAYHLLCGRTPYLDPTPAELLARHFAGQAPRASQIGCPFGAALDDLLSAMLDREPGRRPPLARIREEIHRVGRERRDQTGVVIMQDATRAQLAADHSRISLAGPDLPEGTIVRRPTPARPPPPPPPPRDRHAPSVPVRAELATPQSRVPVGVPAQASGAATPAPSPTTLPGTLRQGPRLPGPDKLPEIPGMEFLDVIGRGGMGCVYRARQLTLDRLVAVKVLTTRPEDPEFGRRFLREARILAQLRHQNIVSVYEAGTAAGGEAFLVMEYVDGSTIHDIVHRDGPLPVGEAVRIARETAKALAYASRGGLVHRDIKPSNLMRTATGRVVVLDFGIARIRDPRPAVADPAAQITISGAVIGTPHYMAPEQWSDAVSADSRSDVYSLGCSLYFMLTGSAPFEGRSLLEILRAHATAARPSVTSQRTDVPAALDSALRRLLAVDPDERPQAAELVRLLTDGAGATDDESV